MSQERFLAHSYLVVIGDVLRRRVELHWLAFEEHLSESVNGLVEQYISRRTILLIYDLMWILARSSNRVATFRTITLLESRRVGSKEYIELVFVIARPLRRVLGVGFGYRARPTIMW